LKVRGLVFFTTALLRTFGRVIRLLHSMQAHLERLKVLGRCRRHQRQIRQRLS